MTPALIALCSLCLQETPYPHVVIIDGKINEACDRCYDVICDEANARFNEGEKP